MAFYGNSVHDVPGPHVSAEDKGLRMRILWSSAITVVTHLQTINLLIGSGDQAARQGCVPFLLDTFAHLIAGD